MAPREIDFINHLKYLIRQNCVASAVLNKRRNEIFVALASYSDTHDVAEAGEKVAETARGIDLSIQNLLTDIKNFIGENRNRNDFLVDLNMIGRLEVFHQRFLVCSGLVSRFLTREVTIGDENDEKIKIM